MGGCKLGRERQLHNLGYMMAHSFSLQSRSNHLNTPSRILYYDDILDKRADMVCRLAAVQELALVELAGHISDDRAYRVAIFK